MKADGKSRVKTNCKMPGMAKMQAGGSVAKAIKAHEKGSAAHRAGLKAGGMAKMNYGGAVKKMKKGDSCK